MLRQEGLRRIAMEWEWLARKGLAVVVVVGVLFGGVLFAADGTAAERTTDEKPGIVATLAKEADDIGGLVRTKAVREWLAEAEHLPPGQSRTLYKSKDRSRYFTEAQFKAMS